jgi:nucleoid-associated protein YgaU
MNRYQDNRILTTVKGKQYYATTLYQNIPLSNTDLYVNTTVGDRYDLLAQQFYGDSSLWWVIPMANNQLVKDSLFPPVGLTIRIPSNVGNIVTEFRLINA